MAGCGPIRPSRRSKWRAATLISVHGLIAVHLVHWTVSGETLTPVEPSEAMQTLELGLLNCGFLLFTASLLLTLIFGRFFCGWACHLLALQDFCAWVLKKVGLKPKPIRSRLLAFVPLGAALYLFAWPTVRRLLEGRSAPDLQPHFTTSDFWATFPGPGMSVLTFVVTGFLVVWWLGSKGFCTYGCPYGGLFGLADRVAPGRILVNESCDGCAHCTATCSSNVRVHEEVKLFKMVVDSGCMKCMDCVDVCPKGALRFGFAKPPVRTLPRRTWSFTWREEIAMVGVFAASLFAFRGLYDSVPFLLSLGLAVLAATSAVSLYRLFRQPTSAWQHLLLKKAGGLTRAGRVAAVAMAAFLAFTVHSGVVQFCTWRGSTLVGAALRMRPSPAQDEACRTASTYLAVAEDLGLALDPRVEHPLAHLATRTGDLAAAEARLRRLVASVPRDFAATLTLANVTAMQGRLPEAEALLTDLVGRFPAFGPARVRLAALREEMARQAQRR
jgi:polyferredoxin